MPAFAASRLTLWGLHVQASERRSNQAPPGRGISRRAMLRASAAFATMAVTAGSVPRSSGAQSTGTLAATWRQPANVGGANATLGFTADFPFHAIAPHWSSDTAFPAAVELQLSADGTNFSDPVTVGPARADAGPKDRDGRVFGDLLFTDTATSVRYRSLDANGQEAGISDLSFTYIDATGGPTLDDIAPASLDLSLARPPIISRAEWGAAQAYGGSDRGAQEWTPVYQTVEHVIIHHSETPSLRDPLAEIRSIHYYHAVTRGWGDIGYNYLVDFLGNVYEGRIGGENVIGGHAYQYAHGSAGICAMGSFSVETSTPEAIAGLTWISAWAARSLDPLGQADFYDVPHLPTICGHRDVNESGCPGDGLYADLDTIRGAVAEVIAGKRDVLTDPRFSPGQIVETNIDGTNLRSRPGVEGGVTTTLPFGAVFQITDGPTTVDVYQWFEVSGAMGQGWVESSLLSPSDALPPVGEYGVGDRLVVNTDLMNIRSEPSIRSSVVAIIPYDEPVEVSEGPVPASGYRWYRLITGYGSGWAVERYLIAPGARKPESRFVTGDSVAVDDPAGLKLRADASSGSSVIASLPTGTHGTVIDGPTLGDRLTWLKIETALGTGWCAELYLIDAITPASIQARFAVGDQIFVDTDWLNVREAPGMDSQVVATLGTRVIGTVLDGPKTMANLLWYHIQTADGSGWCVESFLTLSAVEQLSSMPAIGDTIVVNTDGMNLRAAPGSRSEVIAVLLWAETGTVVDGPVEADGDAWIMLSTSRGDGWGAVQFLGIGMPDPGDRRAFTIGDTVVVVTDGVNVRTDPSLGAGVVRILLSGQRTSIVDGPRQGAGFTWYKVTTNLGEGWAVDRYFSPENLAGPGTGSVARRINGDPNRRSKISMTNGMV